MDEELKNRFFQQKLRELLTDSTKPFPTMICEMEDPKIIELIRKFCLFSPHMKPMSKKDIEPIVKECLDKKKVKDYGELYILVNVN